MNPENHISSDCPECNFFEDASMARRDFMKMMGGTAALASVGALPVLAAKPSRPKPKPAEDLIRELHATADCSGEPFETLEEPFDMCQQYFKPNNTMASSFKFTNANATHFEQHVFFDAECQEFEAQRALSLACESQQLGGGHSAFVTTRIGEREMLGTPAEFALFTYKRYGDVGCKSDMETVDETLEVPRGRCVRFTDFDHWNSEKLRFCTYNDPECGDDFPVNCHIVKLGDCVNTANAESYQATVRFNNATAAGNGTDATGAASALVAALPTTLAAIIFARFF